MKEQVEFLLDVYNAEPIADLLLLKAAFEKDSARDKLIMEAVELKFKAINGIPFGYKFLQSLDTNFILDALKELSSSVSVHFSIQIRFYMEY